MTTEVMEAIKRDRVIAVVRARQVANPAQLAASLAEGGIRCVEFTFTIPGVLDIIEAAGSAAIVGAGTVLTRQQAEDAIAAGARFIVSPALRPELSEPCAKAGIPLLLGALSPTEVVAAVELGAAAVKLFPASLGGPRYLKDIRGPFPEVAFIPSGGIDKTNARQFLEAGAIAVFVGSEVAPEGLVETENHQEIKKRAEGFVSALRSSRQ